MNPRLCLAIVCGLVLGLVGCDAGALSELPQPDADAADEGDAAHEDDDLDVAITLDGVVVGDADDDDWMDVEEEEIWFDVDAGEDDVVLGDVVEPDAVATDVADDTTVEPDTTAEPDTMEPPGPTGPTLETMQFRTLHWNIAGGKENDCATPGIQRAVMRFVRDAGGPVDFVSLNEVCRAQYDAIEAALRSHWGKSANAPFSAFKPSGGSRVGSAIFSRRNLDLVTSLEVGEDQWGKRYLLCGRQVGRRLRVCTAHLSPGDAKARNQMGRVLNKIESWWDNREDTVILAGDLNITPNDPGLNAVYSHWANTPNNPANTGNYREVDDKDPNHCKGYGERTTLGTTGGPCGTGGKIDFTFARTSRIVSGDYTGDSLNIPQDCTGRCSDHRPLRGRIKIRYLVD